MEFDVIITGAGAAGLMAASKLSEAGLRVLILEARNRTGGRIYTLTDSSFSLMVELGAEFIHGNLPVTMKLLNNAGITFKPSGGETYRFENGGLQKDQGQDNYWHELEQKLNGLEKDSSLEEFLNKNFAGERYTQLVQSVKNFAAGYDTADISRASAIALRDEWFGSGEHSGKNYRITKGYSALLDDLEQQVKARGGILYLSKTVQRIAWQKDQVKVLISEGEEFTSCKLIVTVPLGVLQAEKGEGVIEFEPAITDHLMAAKKLGFGAVIKILLEMDEDFYQELESRMPQLGFLLSDTEIPVWWSLFPEKSTLLTGWLGGPKAAELANVSENEIFERALNSLQQVMNKDKASVRQSVRNFRIQNWTNDVFTRGSYSYPTVGSEDAKKILKQPLANTLFFAGEALYGGSEIGTVEAALASGEEAAALLLKNL